VPKISWQPAATLVALQKRAELLGQVRSFFSARAVMEVDTPVVGERGVTDLHIDSVEASVCQQKRYLQTSPEYFMKRLLAAGSGPIYSLGKVFRNEEQGRRHRTEFTLLEWYRPGWDELQLIDEVAALFCQVSKDRLDVNSFSYRDVFYNALAIDPHDCSLDALRNLTAELCGGDWRQERRSTLLDLLFSTQVEPQLPQGLVFVYHYPACQAALARLDKNEQGQTIARRFEVFLNGMELGNGYFELTDPVEQRSRFERDNALRQAAGKALMPIDEDFLAALEAGLPDCAGVAIGIDRLLMQLLGETDIAQVSAF
jgi:lysyl-tRNA synthetase class 2